MSRRLANWLDSYLVYTSGQASPEKFHLWCGISAIAAALERYTWIDRGGYYTLYPNLYILIIADSALYMKSTAINLAAALVRQGCPDVNFVSQWCTPQALVKNLSDIYTERGVSTAFIVNDELGRFLGDVKVSGPMVGLLTQVYGCPSVYDAHTIARSKEVCNDVCLNVLSGSTPEWIADTLSAAAIAGGFAGRILFIYYDGDPRLIGHPKKSAEAKELEPKLVDDLREMRLLRGPFIESPEAIKWFDIWYEKTYLYFSQRIAPFLKGYFGRKGDSLLKLAMILRTAKDNSQRIEAEDMEESLELLNKNEAYLPAIMERIESTEPGKESQRIIALLDRKGRQSYSEILRSLYYCMSAKTLQERLEGMVQSTQLIREIEGKLSYYRLWNPPGKGGAFSRRENAPETKEKQ